MSLTTIDRIHRILSDQIELLEAKSKLGRLEFEELRVLQTLTEVYATAVNSAPKAGKKSAGAHGVSKLSEEELLKYAKG
jgi:hypothetical protein